MSSKRITDSISSSDASSDTSELIHQTFFSQKNSKKNTIQPTPLSSSGPLLPSHQSKSKRKDPSQQAVPLNIITSSSSSSDDFTPHSFQSNHNNNNNKQKKAPPTLEQLLRENGFDEAQSTHSPPQKPTNFLQNASTRVDRDDEQIELFDEDIMFPTHNPDKQPHHTTPTPPANNSKKSKTVDQRKIDLRSSADESESQLRSKNSSHSADLGSRTPKRGNRVSNRPVTRSLRNSSQKNYESDTSRGGARFTRANVTHSYDSDTSGRSRKRNYDSDNSTARRIFVSERRTIALSLEEANQLETERLKHSRQERSLSIRPDVDHNYHSAGEVVGTPRRREREILPPRRAKQQHTEHSTDSEGEYPYSTVSIKKCVFQTFKNLRKPELIPHPIFPEHRMNVLPISENEDSAVPAAPLQGLPEGWIPVIHQNGETFFFEQKSRTVVWAIPYTLPPNVKKEKHIPPFPVLGKNFLNYLQNGDQLNPLVFATPNRHDKKSENNQSTAEKANGMDMGKSDNQNNNEINRNIETKNHNEMNNHSEINRNIETNHHNFGAIDEEEEFEAEEDEESEFEAEGENEIAKLRKRKHKTDDTLEPPPHRRANSQPRPKNYLDPSGKTAVNFLNQYCAVKFKTNPIYQCNIQDDPDFPYVVTVFVANQMYGVGGGLTKYNAKQEAAFQTLDNLCPGLYIPLAEQRTKALDSKEQRRSHEEAIEWELEDPRIPELITSGLTTVSMVREFCASARVKADYTFQQQQEEVVCKLNFRDTITSQLNQNYSTCATGPNRRHAQLGAAQLMLKKLHPDAKTWGDLTKIYQQKKQMIQRELETNPTHLKLALKQFDLLHNLKKEMKNAYPCFGTQDDNMKNEQFHGWMELDQQVSHQKIRAIYPINTELHLAKKVLLEDE